jgi:hypothetical protein
MRDSKTGKHCNCAISHEMHLLGQVHMFVLEILSPAFKIKRVVVAGDGGGVETHGGVEVERATRTHDLLDS